MGVTIPGKIFIISGFCFLIALLFLLVPGEMSRVIGDVFLFGFFFLALIAGVLALIMDKI